MNNIYLDFYTQQTRRLPKEAYPLDSIEKDPYLVIDEHFVSLKPNLLIGRLDHKKTFGFLRQETEDLYLEGRDLMDAMHDDIVLVKEGVEPRVVLIVKRALNVIVATLKKTERGLFFQPDTYIDRRLEVLNALGYVVGHVVMLEVESIDQFAIYAHVKKLIGHVNDPDINTLKIVAAYEWPQQFSEEVIHSLSDIKIDMDQEMKERSDFRNELVITIDGKDAKDLDDAISLKVIDGMYHLGVHIADVSHYVKEGTPLDQEAYRRSTSSYLADRVIPMLPHKLSNDLCSLNAHETKLTLSCLMVINPEGKVVSYEIVKSMI